MHNFCLRSGLPSIFSAGKGSLETVGGGRLKGIRCGSIQVIFNGEDPGRRDSREKKHWGERGRGAMLSVGSCVWCGQILGSGADEHTHKQALTQHTYISCPLLNGSWM